MTLIHDDIEMAKDKAKEARSILDKLYYTSGEFRAEAKPAIHFMITALDFVITNLDLLKHKTIVPK